MARLTKKAINAFKGRRAEEEIYGEEPAKLGAKYEATRENVLHAYNWYAQLGEVKTLRKWLERYVELNYDKNVVTQIKEIKDIQIPITLCAIAKMFFAGCKLMPDQLIHLENRIQEIAMGNVMSKLNEFNDAPREMNVVAADTDAFLDEFYNSDYKKTAPDYFKYLQDSQAKALSVRFVLSDLILLLEEIPEYDLTKKQKKAYVSYVQSLITDGELYLKANTKERKLRKPRKPKIRSAEQQTKNVKFKESDPSLKIVSIEPAKLVGAKSVWLYNVRNRKLTYLEGTLTVKGTTITGFDEKLSTSKVLRKPAVQLHEIINTPRLRMLKAFKAIKTKEGPANGRINNDTILLKADK
jgi:hypothetical protein